MTKQCNAVICYAWAIVCMILMVGGDIVFTLTIPQNLPQPPQWEWAILFIFGVGGYNALIFWFWTKTGRWVHNRYVEFQFIKTRGEKGKET